MDPSQPGEATPGLGLRLEGGARPRSVARRRCENCAQPLVLAAVARKSVFIPLEKFDLISLEMCPHCAEETDGSAGENGFYANLRNSIELLPPPLLPAPVEFRATPVMESPRVRCRMRGKLGGRQLSIQPPLKAGCPVCRSPLVFVCSIDEQWAPDHFNFGGGFGYLFVCKRECSPDGALFYWDCP